MKAAFAALLTVCITFSSAGCGSVPDKAPSIDSIETYTDIPGVTEEEITSIEALKAERSEFSYGALYATDAFVEPDGAYAGFTVKFCGLLSGLFGINFIPELYEWDELIGDLDSYKLDFTGVLTSTENRTGIYNMSSPIAQHPLRVFTIKGSKELKTETDINGLNVGFLKGSVTANAIVNAYPVLFNEIDVEDYKSAAEMLESGAIDAFVGEAVADPYFDDYDSVGSSVFFQMVHEPVSMATANPDLAPVISVVNKYIAAGGVNKLYELYKEGDFDYAKYKLNKSFTDEERAYINDLSWYGNSVSVAYEHDNYPVDFYNEKEQEFEGISVDVLAEISKLTGIRFEPAVTKNTTWAEIYEKLNSGDIRMAAQLLYSEERSGKFIWGTPYAHSYYAFMSKADYPNLANYQVALTTVGVMKNSGMEDIYRQLFPDSDSNLIEYDTQNDCLDALENGEVDLLMASEYMLLTETNYREQSGLKINIKLNVPMDSCFGFRKSERVLCSIIDKAQQFVDTDMIEVSWVGRQFDYSKKLVEQRSDYLKGFISLLLLLLLASVFLLIRNTRLRKQLKEIANTDALTGIYNRRFFMELSEIQFSRSNRTGIDCFVIMIDLDHFKAVNDTYGHLAGDKILKEVAVRVRNSIRPYDIFGRYGGEEFIIIMTDIKPINKDNAISSAERIRREVCKTPIEFGGNEILMTASFGVAYAAPKHDIMTAIAYADEALYKAKESGRNKVIFYEEGSDNERDS